MRPHPKLEEPRSAAQQARIRLQLTLEGESRLTGGRLSRSQLARMEHGAGSRTAWEVLASVLQMPVETILPSPARGTFWLESQLYLPGTSSS